MTIESEIKLTIEPELIRHPTCNHVFDFFTRDITRHKIVNQTDSYRISRRPDRILRFRAHEDSGEIIMCEKGLCIEPRPDGMMSRIEIEEVIATGIPKDALPQWARTLSLIHHPEIAYSTIRRTLAQVSTSEVDFELCIDLGSTYTPQGKLTAQISEVEGELKSGCAIVLEDMFHGLKSHIYEQTGYRMRPGYSKGHLALLGAEIHEKRHASAPSL